MRPSDAWYRFSGNVFSDRQTLGLLHVTKVRPEGESVRVTSPAASVKALPLCGAA